MLSAINYRIKTYKLIVSKKIIIMGKCPTKDKRKNAKIEGIKEITLSKKYLFEYITSIELCRR
jgi:hypothetical protein